MFAAGSALAGLSGMLHFGGFPPIDLLLAARAIQGVGGAVLIPVSLAIVSQAFEGHDKGTAIGIRGAMTGFGSAGYRFWVTANRKFRVAVDLLYQYPGRRRCDRARVPSDR